MEKLYPMREATKILGISLKTLQRWDRLGKVKIVRTPCGRRRVPESEIKRLSGGGEQKPAGRVLAVYARVSSHEQKAKGDLDRQVERIRNRFDHRIFSDILVVTDVSSGLDERRKGLLRLMRMARKGKITDLAVCCKDRLTRFGFNYLKTYFENYGVKIHVVNGKKDEEAVCEELAEDLLSIVTSFSGKLYGIRSKKREEIISKMSEMIERAGYLPGN